MIPIWDGNYNIFVSCILSTENQVKVRLAKGRGVEYTWMTTWTFSLPVSQQTSHQMSSTWEGNWKCSSELKKRESCNGLKGRSWTMTLPQVSMVFSSHQIIRQYTFIQMTRMSSSWTSCSLHSYITLIFSTLCDSLHDSMLQSILEVMCTIIRIPWRYE